MIYISEFNDIQHFYQNIDSNDKSGVNRVLWSKECDYCTNLKNLNLFEVIEILPNLIYETLSGNQNLEFT